MFFPLIEDFTVHNHGVHRAAFSARDQSIDRILLRSDVGPREIFRVREPSRRACHAPNFRPTVPSRALWIHSPWPYGISLSEARFSNRPRELVANWRTAASPELYRARRQRTAIETKSKWHADFMQHRDRRDPASQAQVGAGIVYQRRASGGQDHRIFTAEPHAMREARSRG